MSKLAPPFSADWKAALQTCLSRFNQGRVLVVGDVAIDEMVYGQTDRLSREAPVLILHHQKTDVVLGAASNTAHNIAKLGAKRSALVGVYGDDYQGMQLKDAFTRDGIDISGLIEVEGRPTTTKTRISGTVNHSVTQQMVRIDREARTPLPKNVEKMLIRRITAMASEFDAMLLSDYDLGVLTPAVIAACLDLAKTHSLPVSVDSHRDFSLFHGATILTPNQPEAEQNVGYEIEDDASLERAGLDLLEKAKASNVLITQGGAGMTLFESQPGQAFPKAFHVPAFSKSDVFDVTGAGDTVVGTLTLALATGATMQQATVLGNLAASVVVRRFGASTTTVNELEALL